LSNLRTYKVTAYKGLREIQQEGVHHFVEAPSPESAALQVLGERLILFGKVSDLRARVTFVGLSGDTKTVLFYRPPS
jgi:hypothetical protein